jgi:hypothetical protein
MSQAQQRLLIALKSPVQARVDTRPRCEDCGSVLTRRDFASYWDGMIDLINSHAVPRCCENCAEEMEAGRLKSV